MKERIEYLLNHYLNDKNKKVDRNKKYYKKFVNELPKYLERYFDEDKYKITASCGQGNKCEVPWLAIFRKEITTSATNGIYICYLFRKDMSGFYLTITQGITRLQELIEKDKYENMRKTGNFFRKSIRNNYFSKEDIDLKAPKNPTAKGYEESIVISKYYDKDNLKEEELIEDLLQIKKIYDKNIYSKIENSSYDDIILQIVSEPNQNYNKQNKNINNKISTKVPIPEQKKQNTKTKKNNNNNNNYKNNNRSKKVDQNRNKEIGDEGEECIFDTLKDNLKKAGREDLIKKIKKWYKDDDTKGYDIESPIIDENGKVKTIYIEVKTTTGPDTTPFYISKKENSMMKKYKDKYYIYRVYDVEKNPRHFEVNYKDLKEKFELEEASYIVNIK